MRLDVNPYDQIPKPRFGDLDQKKQLEDQWKEWKKNTQLARDVYKKLKDKEKYLGGDPDDVMFRKFLGDLTESDDRVVMNLRNDLSGLTDRFTSQVVLEGVRRYLDSRKGNPTVNEKGYLPWEEEK